MTKSSNKSRKNYKGPRCAFCNAPLSDDFKVTVDKDGKILGCCHKCFHLAEIFVKGEK